MSTYRKPGSVADVRHAEMLAEIEYLRAQRHEAALTPSERKWRDRRLLVIPLYALGMTTPEVSASLGLKAAVEGWVARDPEIKWWATAAHAARRDVLAPAESLRDRYRRRAAEFRDRHRAQRDENGRSLTLKRHGTVTGYRAYSCRCDDCKAAGAADNRRRYLADGVTL